MRSSGRRSFWSRLGIQAKLSLRQEILYECSDLGVGTLTGVDALWDREDGGHAASQLLADHGCDFRFELRPRSLWLLADGHHIVGHEHVPDPGNLEQTLRER
jgi:hypothetical protein